MKRGNDKSKHACGFYDCIIPRCAIALTVATQLSFAKKQMWLNWP